nr:folate family ECF transporter S component [uncultured Dethiosulfovibrio sp.]
MKFSTRKLVILALMVSLNVVLTRFASVRIAIGGIEGIRIGFGTFPAILAGLTMGPLAGAMVGAVGDVVGFVLHPMGAYLPHFTVTAALTGILPSLFWKVMGKSERFLPVMAAIGGSQMITSVILVPILLNHLFSLPMATTIPGAAVSLVMAAPVYTMLFLRLHRAIDPSAVAIKG